MIKANGLHQGARCFNVIEIYTPVHSIKIGERGWEPVRNIKGMKRVFRPG
jgi:hypothetical protein